MNGYSSTYVSFLEKRKGTWRKEGEERNYLRDILITVTRKLLNCSFVTFKRKEMYRIRYRKYRLSSKTTFFPSFAVDFRCKETRFHGHKVLRVFLYWLDVPRAGKLRQKKLKLDVERERKRRRGKGEGEKDREKERDSSKECFVWNHPHRYPLSFYIFAHFHTATASQWKKRIPSLYLDLVQLFTFYRNTYYTDESLF